MADAFAAAQEIRQQATLQQGHSFCASRGIICSGPDGGQPASTNSDSTGTPPPVPVPGAPESGWKWSPDSGNPRGGTWTPTKWTGPGSPPSASWEPGKNGKPGHWDVDNGKGKKNGGRQRYDEFGKPITPGEAHASSSLASRAGNFAHAHPVATAAAGVAIVGAAAAVIILSGGTAAPVLAPVLVP
jgi:hypothetical protein